MAKSFDVAFKERANWNYTVNTGADVGYIIIILYEAALYHLFNTNFWMTFTNIDLQAKDITDLGTLKEASKIFVPG
jgi:hypothetical protein